MPPGPVYQSRIGDKYSKKKAVISSMGDNTPKFAGTGYKLSK
jgi:hypothetical protein